MYGHCGGIAIITLLFKNLFVSKQLFQLHPDTSCILEMTIRQIVVSWSQFFIVKQGCPWDIFISPVPSHSNLCLSHPYDINEEYSSTKIMKFMKV